MVYKNVLLLAFTYIDNKESCSNQQGTCCIVSHELRTYRDTVRCMDRTRYHMSPKDYTRKLKKSKKKIKHKIYNNKLKCNATANILPPRLLEVPPLASNQVIERASKER